MVQFNPPMTGFGLTSPDQKRKGKEPPTTPTTSEGMLIRSGLSAPEAAQHMLAGRLASTTRERLRIGRRKSDLVPRAGLEPATKLLLRKRRLPFPPSGQCRCNGIPLFGASGEIRTHKATRSERARCAKVSNEATLAKWCCRPGSNRTPRPYQDRALT